MKIIPTILVLASLCWQCLATAQMPDVFIQGEIKGALSVSFYQHPSPLEQYFSKHDVSKPFGGRHTANYRGYIAHWEVIENKLYLKKIMIEGEGLVKDSHGKTSKKLAPYDLSIIFKTGVTEKGVFADWFTGSFSVRPDFRQADFFLLGNIEYIFKKGTLVERRDLRRKGVCTNFTVTVRPELNSEKTQE